MTDTQLRFAQLRAVHKQHDDRVSTVNRLVSDLPKLASWCDINDMIALRKRLETILTTLSEAQTLHPGTNN